MRSRLAIRLDPQRELEELQEYLGPRYRHAGLRGHRRGVARELAEFSDEQAFYRRSEAYLYDLTAFAMSGTKIPYLEQLARRLPPGATLLDYGCGIGSDGLLLLDAGYEVAFADFDNPSTRYLRWRLERRGLEAPVYDLDADRVPAGFDAGYAFDVIEHVEDPFAFLAELEARAKLVAVNLLEDDPDELAPHRPLPIGSLLAHASNQRLHHYRRYHGGRSHLLLYSPAPPRPSTRLRSRGVLWKGRIRHRVGSARRVRLTGRDGPPLR